MTVTAPKSRPSRNPSRDASAPALALERPQNLKKWAADLVSLLKGEETRMFADWDFGPGSLTRLDFTRILKKISGCGSVVELRAAMDYQTGEVGRPAVHAANYCGQHTICPYCAGRVQDRRAARFKAAIMAAANKYPFAYMLTATIPPVPSWRDDLNQLIAGWQNFRRMGQIRKRKRKDGSIKETRSGGEFGKVRAGVAKIEIKRGKGSGLPHCHYHALVFTNQQIDFRVFETAAEAEKYFGQGDRTVNPLVTLPDGTITTKINYEWWKATGGTATNLRVDPIQYRYDKDGAKGRTLAESIYDQSREVLKYATKFDSHPEKDQVQLFARDFVGIRDATYNRRLFCTYGDFREVRGDDFTGGGPALSEKPMIYESRWRGFSYSPLMQRSRPVFSNMEKTPYTTERLSILNGVQGRIRRQRFAILRSKNHYRETGELRPAFFNLKEPGDAAGRLCAMEPPESLALDPTNSKAWEKWVDDTISAGRQLYDAARETLDLMTLDRLDGTIEEQEATRAAMARAWRESAAYVDHVAELFRETLNSSRPASSPAP